MMITLKVLLPEINQSRKNELTFSFLDSRMLNISAK